MFFTTFRLAPPQDMACHCKCKFGCGAEGRNKRGCGCTGGKSHACLGLARLCQEAVDGIEAKQAEGSENEWTTIKVDITVSVKIPSKKKDDVKKKDGVKKKDDEEEDEGEEKHLPKGWKLF